MRKDVNIWVLVTVIVILQSCNVFAFGVSPAGKTVNYEPGIDTRFDFWAINSEGVDLALSLSGVGELSPVLFFSNQTILLRRGELRTPFQAVLKMPVGLSPGLHEVFIRMTPVVGEQSEMFQVYASPLVPLRVRVPYPSKYAVISLFVGDSQEGVPAPIQLEMDNLGSEDISRAGGSVRIFNSGGVLLHTLEAGPIGVGKNSVEVVEALPRVTLASGSYRSTVDAYYDNNTVRFDSNFSVGAPRVRITGLSSRWAYIGELSPVKFRAKLDWDAPIQAKIFLSLGDRVTESPVFILEPGKEQELSGLVDAVGYGPENTGEYTIKVQIVYGSRVEEEMFNIRLVEHGAVEAVDSQGSLAVILLSVLLILGVVCFVLFWMMRHKRQD